VPNTAIKIHYIQYSEIHTNIREATRRELGSWYWQQRQWTCRHVGGLEGGGGESKVRVSNLEDKNDKIESTTRITLLINKIY